SMVMQAKKIHITSSNGTDVWYETHPDYAFDIDDGDYSQPIFGTAPGYVNIVPKQGSMNGRIVFDVLMDANLEGENQVEFLMKEGVIIEVCGNAEAEKFSTYLAAFEDPNMYKISHNMIGLNPGVRELTGNIVEDERIWGGVDFGFGHTSPMDMPPDGQEAKSHFDGVVGKVSILLDGVEIIREGEVIHPALVPLADKLLS
ncbi:MAG: aminopeptidase, partial [Bacteroidota bacterium]